PASATTTERLRRTDQASLAQAIPKELDAVSIVVKFHEGTEVRVESARLTGDAVSSARSRASIQRDLDEVTATFARTGTRAEPLFRVPRSRLKQLNHDGRQWRALPGAARRAGRLHTDVLGDVQRVTHRRGRGRAAPEHRLGPERRAAVSPRRSRSVGLHGQAPAGYPRPPHRCLARSGDRRAPRERTRQLRRRGL